MTKSSLDELAGVVRDAFTDIEPLDSLAASARRLREAQVRIDKTGALADRLIDKPKQHQRAVATLLLLQDCLFEMTQAHDMLVRLVGSVANSLPQQPNPGVGKRR